MAPNTRQRSIGSRGLAISVLRGKWDKNANDVDDETFLHPTRHRIGLSEDDGENRIWDARMMEIISAVVTRMYEALEKAWGEDFESLSSAFSRTLVRFGNGFLEGEGRHHKGRPTMTVDGADGPVKAKVSVRRFVGIEAIEGRACPDPTADSDKEAFHEWCERTIEEVARAVSPIDRRTFEARGRGESAEKAASGTGMTGQTVRNRHRRAVLAVAPDAVERLREDGGGGRSGKLVLEGWTTPTGRAQGGEGSPPMQEPGE